MALTWPKALGWRLGRQLLDPIGHSSVADVVARLGTVPAWPDAAAELAVGTRRQGGRSGDVSRALEAAKLVKVFLFRGAMHYLRPHDAGDRLALRASSKMWELPSWVSYYGLAPDDWPRFREYVRNALTEGPLTRTELAAALGRSSRYRHLRDHLAGGNETLLKPLTWQGDMGLGRTATESPRSCDSMRSRVGAASPTSRKRARGWWRRISGATAPRLLIACRAGWARASVSSARPSHAGWRGSATGSSP